jgi:ABC-type dipeptide/oligopeptide/nickel transport system permease component
MLLFLAPGDVARLILIQKSQSEFIPEAAVSEFAAEKGLDANFLELYLKWLGRVAQGDLGESYLDGASINRMIDATLPKTITMVLIALGVYFVLGVTVGMLAAVYRKGWFARLAKYWAVLSTAIPSFWIGLFTVWLLSVKLGILKFVGSHGNSCLILAGILMGVISSGNLITIVKHKTLLVLEEQFVMMARALGVKKRTIMLRHVLKNILAPTVATTTLAFSNFLGSSLLMENVFSISGFGTLLTKSINLKDYAVVASALLVLGIIISIANMIADIAYSLIDRRESV